MDDIRVERLEGDRLSRHLGDVARLRIAIFGEYPYLYDGSLDYEERYLELYASTAGAVVITAFDGDRLIGASTGLPMLAEPPSLWHPLAAAGYDIARVFYFGESVLDHGYRGRGIGVRFFNEREAQARRLGGFSHTVFCSVIRPADHPRRPQGHRPLDGFWTRRGYRSLEGVVGSIAWKEHGELHDTPKAMQFWGKEL